jgi:hypothetical protein
VRRLALVLLAAFVPLAALALAACGDRRNLRPDEAEIVAWWIEDVAHGLPRRAEELRLVDASERMAHVADWASGDEIRGERQPPRLLLARRNRHALLATMLEHGQAVLDGKGLLAPRPGLELAEREVVEPVVDAENRDRRQLDAIVLALADVQQDGAADFLAAARKARTELDQQAGGKIWESPAK